MPFLLLLAALFIMRAGSAFAADPGVVIETTIGAFKGNDIPVLLEKIARHDQEGIAEMSRQHRCATLEKDTQVFLLDQDRTGPKWVAVQPRVRPPDWPQSVICIPPSCVSDLASNPAFQVARGKVKGRLYVARDTFGAFGDVNAKALSELINADDQAGIAAMCRQHEAVAVEKGIIVSEHGWIPVGNMDPVAVPHELLQRWQHEIIYLPRNCLSEDEVAMKQFKIEDLPRVPIHTPRRRPNQQELSQILLANADNHIPVYIDQGTYVHAGTEKAIALMFHLDNELEGGSKMVTNSYVTYGPIPDAHNATDSSSMNNTWLVEVAFNILGDPTQHNWIAVLHVKVSGDPASCELGADQPTLKDDDAQPRVTTTPVPNALLRPAPQVVAALTPKTAPEDGRSSVASAQESLILRLNNAIEAHDYATVLSFVPAGRTDYFGHRNASNAFIAKDMKGDARTYRWTKSIPDLSTFRTFTDASGIVHESIQMETSAEEFSGRRHHAFVQMDIFYRDESSPSILSMDLRVIR